MLLPTFTPNHTDNKRQRQVLFSRDSQSRSAEKPVQRLEETGGNPAVLAPPCRAPREGLRVKETAALLSRAKGRTCSLRVHTRPTLQRPRICVGPRALRSRRAGGGSTQKGPTRLPPPDTPPARIWGKPSLLSRAFTSDRRGRQLLFRTPARPNQPRAHFLTVAPSRLFPLPASGSYRHH